MFVKIAKLIFCSFMLCILFLEPAVSQTVIAHRDPEITAMVQDISAEQLEKNIRKLASFGTRHTLSQTESNTEGIGAARNWVKSEFEKYAEESEGRLVVELDAFDVPADGRRITEDARLANVMATLEGTDPEDERILIISGHLDSRASDVMDSNISAPGANDDGSGVAVVMELARVMSKRAFPATIIFVAVSGEEQGLIGARHLAEKAKENNWNIVAMLNNDMVGNSSSSGTNLKDNTQVRVFSEGVPKFETEEMERMRQYTAGENDSKSRQLARYIKEIGERYVAQLEVTLNYRSDRFLRGGDHTPFSQNGFTAVRLTEINENYYQQHQDVRVENGIQYGDLPEFVDFEYARKIAGVNLSTLANLALAPAAPENVGIDVSQLSNESLLKWEDAKGTKPYGYYVLMRETYRPFWEKKIFVKGNEAVLPYSKDNYFFAVQAVDEDGHESLPIFPAPIR